jgi:hypothetical protein
LSADPRARCAQSAIVGIIATCIAIAAALGLVLPWQAASKDELRQIDVVNVAEHKAIRDDVSKLSSGVEDVGRDVKTIKCLMLAPSNKAKQRCGLE